MFTDLEHFCIYSKKVKFEKTDDGPSCKLLHGFEKLVPKLCCLC